VSSSRKLVWVDTRVDEHDLLGLFSKQSSSTFIGRLTYLKQSSSPPSKQPAQFTFSAVSTLSFALFVTSLILPASLAVKCHADTYR
jgi:hypothetical protein